MACISCGAGLHNECVAIDNDGKCCCLNNSPVAESLEEDDENDNWRKPRRKGKRDATLRDQQSTGRKRAAVKYPLDFTGPCEWRYLKMAGGGKYPLVGCREGLQQARHHGPDKNTLNNDEGNVHRICHKCHNRWHARNDPGYVPGEISNRHDAFTLATDEEYLENEIYFADHTPRKVKAD
jgi:hypothetical protein